MEKETKSIQELIADSKKHNGWTNYETWRIHLEFFSDNYDFIIERIEEDEKRADMEMGEYDMAHMLHREVMDFIDTQCDLSSLVNGWANAFVSECNFYEIARHIRETMVEQQNNIENK